MDKYVILLSILIKIGVSFYFINHIHKANISKGFIIMGILFEILFFSVYYLILPELNNTILYSIFYENSIVNFIYNISYTFFPLGLLIYFSQHKEKTTS